MTRVGSIWCVGVGNQAADRRVDDRPGVAVLDVFIGASRSAAWGLNYLVIQTKILGITNQTEEELIHGPDGRRRDSGTR
jgi:hypothetical protein